MNRAENGAERAENRMERGTGVAENDGAGAGGCGARSRLDRWLTVRSNLTFHSTDFITYIVRTELSAVYSFSHDSFTVHALALSFVQTQPKAFLTRPDPSHRQDAF